jgi:hypothetical protein
MADGDKLRLQPKINGAKFLEWDYSVKEGDGDTT